MFTNLHMDLHLNLWWRGLGACDECKAAFPVQGSHLLVLLLGIPTRGILPMSQVRGGGQTSQLLAMTAAVVLSLRPTFHDDRQALASSGCRVPAPG